MKNILLTGGSGFIGRHLVGLLRLRYENVVIINVDLKPSRINGVTNIIADIRDYKEMVTALQPFEIDTCIHLAALCKEPGFEWDEYFNTNYLGTKNVIRLCKDKGVEKILFTSTMMVFKAGDKKNFDDSLTAPDSAYGISKLLAEKELKNWSQKEKGRTLKIVRPAVVFGENENGNFTKLLFQLKKGFFPYIGRKSTVKANIYVLELVNFIAFLLKTKNESDVFNFCFPENSELSNIIDLFKKEFELKVYTPVLPYRFMLVLAYFFEIMDSIGLKNSMHHRRIQKLYYSTNIFPQNAIDSGYKFEYTLETALVDWKLKGI
ncbi:Nucleoside-diphosphate-sugar epimerase [Reichenbachiella agariperforans]|uniref:Nucleoside-diphosphate-sugar epimerase n=1 Tax=Reichenbachiella agariperforans TaxID=156994 RepID=A0A1M6NU40_REIAG|nr:NAD(P)-dependent oxidoreductase [Reichenbachiella agariperforans]SHJ99239.1 Nucleoside-diphosphate-sugar epimerase [Reichenbachiella agariperforans]